VESRGFGDKLSLGETTFLSCVMRLVGAGACADDSCRLQLPLVRKSWLDRSFDAGGINTMSVTAGRRLYLSTPPPQPASAATSSTVTPYWLGPATPLSANVFRGDRPVARPSELETWQQELRTSFPRMVFPEHRMQSKDALFLKRSQDRWAARLAAQEAM
jgi:hypothetical protein